MAQYNQCNQRWYTGLEKIRGWIDSLDQTSNAVWLYWFKLFNITLYRTETFLFFTDSPEPNQRFHTTALQMIKKQSSAPLHFSKKKKLWNSFPPTHTKKCVLTPLPFFARDNWISAFSKYVIFLICTQLVLEGSYFVSETAVGSQSQYGTWQTFCISSPRINGIIHPISFTKMTFDVMKLPLK